MTVSSISLKILSQYMHTMLWELGRPIAKRSSFQQRQILVPLILMILISNFILRELISQIFNSSRDFSIQSMICMIIIILRNIWKSRLQRNLISNIALKISYLLGSWVEVETGDFNSPKTMLFLFFIVSSNSEITKLLTSIYYFWCLLAILCRDIWIRCSVRHIFLKS